MPAPKPQKVPAPAAHLAQRGHDALAGQPGPEALPAALGETPYERIVVTFQAGYDSVNQKPVMRRFVSLLYRKGDTQDKERAAEELIRAIEKAGFHVVPKECQIEYVPGFMP